MADCLALCDSNPLTCKVFGTWSDICFVYNGYSGSCIIHSIETRYCPTLYLEEDREITVYVDSTASINIYDTTDSDFNWYHIDCIDEFTLLETTPDSTSAAVIVPIVANKLEKTVDTSKPATLTFILTAKSKAGTLKSVPFKIHVVCDPGLAITIPIPWTTT